MDNLSVFAERLREYMDDTDLTQDKLTKIAGCGRGSISTWLNAKRFPYIKNLIRLSGHFNCSIDFLLGRAELPEIKNLCLISNFTERLKSLAKENNKTLFAISVELKIDDAILYNWANDKYSPSVHGLIMLADYFGCSIDYLIGRND